MIDKISNATRAAIEAASAKSLPDNPSGRGMTADEIRRKFWEPLTSAGSNLADEIDRVVGEANAYIEEAIEKAESDLAKETASLDADINAAVAKAEGELTTEKNERETSENDIRDNISAVSKALENHKADAEEMFDTLEAQIVGITTSYVIQGIPEIESNLSEIGAKLKTGDKIFSIDKNIPDLWFESKNNTDGAETFVYKDEYGNERTIDLIVMETSSPYTVYGILHVIESNAVNFGDLEAVLDSIIAYQEQLIGGDA